MDLQTVPSLSRNWMPTILCWGGIGDTLRNIALVPHEAIYKATGLRFRVVHRPWREAGCLAHAEPPAPEYYQRLIERIPSLEWRGESGEHKGLPRALNKALRDCIRALDGGTPRYFPIDFRLAGSEEDSLPEMPPGRVIGVQTHLTGMRTKRWGLENWRRFLQLLTEEFPELGICLLDTAPEVEELRLSARIFTTARLSLPQSIHLCRRFGLLVSIDSWTKYVGAWSRIPQVIVVPDQRSEYPALTAEKLQREEFSGIVGNPQNTILGLEKVGSKYRLSLPSIADLTPEALFEVTSQSLRRLERSRGERPSGR